MASQTITFRYLTGIPHPLFSNARLRGSWTVDGDYSDDWTEHPMREIVGPDGCPAFETRLQLRDDPEKTVFHWGVILDGPERPNLWGIPTEVPDPASVERFRSFRLQPGDAHQIETFYLTFSRRLGANKVFHQPDEKPGLQFSVWAPNAQAIEVVFGLPDNGYITNDGIGIDPHRAPVPLKRSSDPTLWQSPVLPDFRAFERLPYMYKLLNAQGDTVYRTDIFSRSQIGCGSINPENSPNWPGTIETLDGAISCSMIIDPDTISRDFEPPTDHDTVLIPANEFWANEFTPTLPVPTQVDDLVIYELHIGALGFGKDRPGDLTDAIALLDYLTTLGINTIELLPMAEFTGSIAWGYGGTHHFVIESSAGGRDQYRHFVRECHQRGIAVIQDVVYNHYNYAASRSQWQYDSTAPEDNSYYWYEGRSADYEFPDGGYLDNGSSGWSPRFSEEVVRQQFISSAAFLIDEMHIDGLRVDLTQAIHRDNCLHATGHTVGRANQFGQKLLREWSRTLKMIRPNVMLIAEDHTGWEAVTKPAAAGGLGFDAAWYVDFYHNLIGDAKGQDGKARLLKQAGLGFNDPLPMRQFAGALYQSQYNRVVFHESHDEAGNHDGPLSFSTARTMVVAVNDAPITGLTRFWAERRSRTVFGLSLLSAGTSMFFMGEEIGAQRRYKYDTFIQQREDLWGERAGAGAPMYRFYQDLIAVSKRLNAIRSKNIDILHVQDDTRVLAFKRWLGNEQVLIIASLNNQPFHRYTIYSDAYRLPSGGWKEIFNSDADQYGGSNVGNGGAVVPASNGQVTVTLPASGFVIFVQQ
ncbi:alpha-amylase family glycosyl hydrolase [Larkinella bovis]|uniref:1,4-alpha-glucan branching enzyme n=1 Tax=Larkinella bovis TaxID=683041 RepID=A0ABW0I5H3_9BACT